MNRKAYFFLMDAIFALVILMIGFMVITSTKPSNIDEVPLAQVSENLVDILSSVKIKEICDEECVCSNEMIETFCPSIKNKDQTILDYLGELYNIDPLQTNQKAMRVFRSVIEDLYRKDLYGIELIINNHKLYGDGNKETSLNLITAKRVLFGFNENPTTGNLEFWGPYLLEINVWEK